MPSATFFHLPPAKREKLLQCAREEFSRVSFDEASINRIVHQAEISRGSFYMYFTDKADLFRYLLQCYLDELTQMLEELLTREQGDLFAAFEALFQTLAVSSHSSPQRWSPAGRTAALGRHPFSFRRSVWSYRRFPSLHPPGRGPGGHVPHPGQRNCPRPVRRPVPHRPSACLGPFLCPAGYPPPRHAETQRGALILYPFNSPYTRSYCNGNKRATANRSRSLRDSGRS